MRDATANSTEDGNEHGYEYSIKEAVKFMYPARVKAPSSLFSCNIKGGTYPKQRFSELLLEHGERHLQDWAVIASSSVCPSPSSSEGDMPKKESRSRTRRNNPNSATKRNHKNSIGRDTENNKNVSASSSMQCVEGRLRLCSRSIVFEPNDVSRGIIRCPLDRMERSPYPASKQEQEQDQNLVVVVVVKSSKHLVMKANNAITPFRTETIATEFQFSFLHSTPQKFFELSNTLYSMVKSPESKIVLEDIVRPMLDRPFDPSNFANIRERPVTNNLRCSLLSPLLSTSGCCIVTDERVYFQPASGIFSSAATTRALSWSLTDIVATARRYHGLKDCAMELFMNDPHPSVLLAFENPSHREQAITSLKLPSHIPCHTDYSFVVQTTTAWRLGRITNFEYLLALNSASGRTFHDLSRYPVFPWIIADYRNSKLDFTQVTKTFRDLTKPIGALNKERLENFKERLESMRDMENPFLYGTHYSAPGYVLYYLVRNMPEHMLCLQNGKFDTSDRLFYSVDHCFNCVLTNPADLKESIPEFYDPTAGSDFLINTRGLQLGTTQTNIHVNDVILPPWARSPKDFLKKNRKALESDYCTKMLPRWIDLIFGFKSRGKEAEKAMNLFHSSAYLSPSDLESMPTPHGRVQAELQATEFGIVPDLLFCDEHPSKGDMEVLDDFVESSIGRSHYEFETFVVKQDSSLQRDQWEVLQTNTSSPMTKEELEKSPQTIPSTRVKDSTSGNNDMSTKINLLATNERTIGNLSSFPNITKNNEFSSWVSNHLENGQPSETEISSQHIDQSTNLSLSGSSTINQSNNNQVVGSSGTFSNKPMENVDTKSNKSKEGSNLQSPPRRAPTDNQQGWELKVITSKRMHGDAVSGCHLALQENSQKNSYIVTVSLDGGLVVHKLPSSQQENEPRRAFAGSSTLGRFASLNRSAESNQTKFHSFRSHSSGDPLACLSVVGDTSGGYIAFAGGHDDIVLAYGINSACALASVYSHRDAVTGIDIIPFNRSVHQFSSGTHIMVSGSWDATIKLWSVIIADGETVSINRDPLAEFYDADSTIISVAIVEVKGYGFAFCAGCSDGSLVIWSWNGSREKNIIFKEDSRREYGACSSLKWTDGQYDEKYLIAGFANGRVVSYILSNGIIRPVSKLHIGSSVQCLSLVDNVLFAGCSDGGIRLVPLGEGFHFDYNPRLWRAVNGVKAPGITSIDAAIPISTGKGKEFICASGGEDGSVNLFSVEEVPQTQLFT